MLWQESKLKTQRQQVCQSIMIWAMPKRQDSQPESPKSSSRDVTVGDSLSDIATCKDKEDVEEEEDDEEHTELSKLSKDDKPGWVMGTISKSVQQRMDSLGPKQMRIDKLTQPGWRDVANLFCQSDLNYGTAELTAPAFGKVQTDKLESAPAVTTFCELTKTLDIVIGISQMLLGTSQPGSCHVRQRSGTSKTHKQIAYGVPMGTPD